MKINKHYLWRINFCVKRCRVGAMMKWKFATDNQTYLLSAVTCVLFIIGSIVYSSIHFGIIT
nr:DUF4181 domain-containing protein [Gracilibacillus suaedae]